MSEEIVKALVIWVFLTVLFFIMDRGFKKMVKEGTLTEKENISVFPYWVIASIVCAALILF